MKKTVFVISYERPIYLWATLDGLYRATKDPVEVLVIDQGSKDPMVRSVIDGFVARGLITEVFYNDSNDAGMLEKMLRQHFGRISDVFFYVENDAVIYESDICWTRRFIQLMDQNHRLAMLGSAIDPADFVAREDIERHLGRAASAEELDAIKMHSPERTMPVIGTEDIATPFNPPGRLLALRKEAIASCRTFRDGIMHRELMAAGWETGITGAVRHRHLSLYNFFDYPEYSMAARDEFMNSGKKPSAKHNSADSNGVSITDTKVR